MWVAHLIPTPFEPILYALQQGHYKIKISFIVCPLWQNRDPKNASSELVFELVNPDKGFFFDLIRMNQNKR